ncbi:MAG: glycerophosphodiester phosphodiesterase family protein [Sedimenticola sp.]|nr:glycerophosphodiester phosphodiesterase family protein [Sedimenticola sp.]
MTITRSQLVAHRGYMEHYPENCWSGLQAALDLGAHWIEFDIQMNVQDHFILLHDADFQRTAGQSVSVFGLHEKQMASISVHEPARLGAQYAPEPIITLEQLLLRLEQYPDARAMVEIKEESLDHWGLIEVMKPLLTLLETNKKQCVLISFSLDALSYAKKNSNIDLGWVLRRYNDKSLQEARKLSPEFLICNHTKLPQDAPPTKGPWQWMLYDITDPLEVKQWGEKGIDLIETRDIGLLISHPDFNQ